MMDTIKGFVSKKTGKMFGAKLTYDSEQKRITFVYEKKKQYRKILNSVYKINKKYDVMKVTKYL